MPTEGHKSNDFISYPIDRVVATVVDSTQAREAIEALLQRGVAPEHIDVLYGDSGLHRLDPHGAEHGFWAQFQRTLINTMAVNEESSHLRHHVEDLRAGRIVIMVLVNGIQERVEIGQTLSASGAEHLGFFGRWAWEA